MVVRRGEVWWADLGEPPGSSPGYRRPVIVISDDAFNASSIATVVVVILTSNMRFARARGNLELASSVTGLPKASTVNDSQLYTIDRMQLLSRVKMLRKEVIADLDVGLKLSLGLA